LSPSPRCVARDHAGRTGAADREPSARCSHHDWVSRPHREPGSHRSRETLNDRAGGGSVERLAATIMRMAGLVWLEFQSAGRRKIKRITAESVRRLRDASDH